MKLTSYWLDTSEPFGSAARGPVQGTCDVAVIGGGLTGSSAALALAKKGARVVLLEAETLDLAGSREAAVDLLFRNQPLDHVDPGIERPIEPVGHLVAELARPEA